MAHIGIINWLEDNGFHIASVSGASMGALVGGIYAAGKLDEYASWLLALTRADIVKLLDFSFERSGLFKGRRIMDALKDLLGSYRIEVNAVDMEGEPMALALFKALSYQLAIAIENTRLVSEAMEKQRRETAKMKFQHAAAPAATGTDSAVTMELTCFSPIRAITCRRSLTACRPPNRRSRRWRMTKPTGTIRRVSTAEVRSPPMTTTATT